MMLTFDLKSQVKHRSPRLLPNLEKDRSLLEGLPFNSSFSVHCCHFTHLHHIISFSVLSMYCRCLPFHSSIFAVLCRLPLCDPSIPVCVSHCPVAPINPKTHLGLPWSNQNPRRRKPLPLPLPDWQHHPIQALCHLSKGRAPDPARPPHPPTHSTRMRMKLTRQRRRRGLKRVQFQRQL